MRYLNLFLVFLFFILLTLFSLNIPFFWDGTFFSELSVTFYESGFHGFIAPPHADTGGFPLYSLYLTIVWKLFGKTLAVSHWAMLPFLLGITYQYYKLAKRFLKEKFLSFALLMLIIEPAFITQSILMGYDILMICFFFLSLNALLEENKNLYRIGLILLCLSSMRGIMLCVSLLLIDISIHYTNHKKLDFNFRNYIPALLTVLCWALYHHQQTGWFFFSPAREHTDETTVPILFLFRQLAFIAWKIADFGRLVLWLFLLVAGIYYYKRQSPAGWNTLLLIISFPLLILSCFMAPIAISIAHKYFIVVFLCLNIGACYLLQQLKNRKLQFGALILFCITLFGGNFWLYPERFGNGWDSSLKVLVFFPLKDKMDDFIQKEHIPNDEIGTQFPLIADRRYSHLSDSSVQYQNLWKGPLTNYTYFLQTNVINTDIPDQFEDAKKNWILLKHLEAGQVNISLYKNNEVLP